MTDRTGRCLCGSVRYTVRNATDVFGACHCTMCQRISGGVNMSFNAPAEAVTVTGIEHVRSYRSSDWAERSFCEICGANLWYRGIAAPGEASGYSIGFGSLDDKSGMRFAHEICIDTKPEAYAFVGERVRKTSAEMSQ